MKSHLAWSLRKWDIRSLLSLRTVGFLEALRAGGHGKGGGLDIEGEARPPLAARCQSKLGGGALRSRQGLSRTLPWAPSTAIRGESSTCRALARTDMLRKA